MAVLFSDKWVLENITAANIKDVMIDRGSEKDIANLAIKYDDKRVCSLFIEEFKKKKITKATRDDAAEFVLHAMDTGSAFMLRELFQLEGYGLLSQVQNKKVDLKFVKAKPEVFKLLVEFGCDCCSASLLKHVLYEANNHHTISIGIIQHAPMHFLDRLDNDVTACANLKEAIRRRRAGEPLGDICIEEVD